jgi:lipoprotein-releasing system ATP-binding protein
MSETERPVEEVPGAAGQMTEPPSAPAEASILLEARGVAKSYRVGSGRLEVLKGVDLDVREGEILAILGKSGCGKSTLLHVLGWLDAVDKGQILYQGVDHATLPAMERARLRNVVMGFVFQFYHLLPELSALENVLVPAMIRHGTAEWRRRRREVKERARALLAIVGLGHRMRHRPSQLSGGERQRVAIARALIKDAPIILLDEATASLDSESEQLVQDAMARLCQGRTTIAIAHRLQTITHADRILVVESGAIVESGRHDELLRKGGRYAAFYRLQTKEQAHTPPISIVSA